jgi:hypothetical protein
LCYGPSEIAIFMVCCCSSLVVAGFGSVLVASSLG